MPLYALKKENTGELHGRLTTGAICAVDMCV